jgi:hypothetical protein
MIEAALSHENYPDGVVDALKAEIAGANDILANPLITQREAEDAIRSLQTALDALVHDHPVKAHSHPKGVNTSGTSVCISIKGHFYDVLAVNLGNKIYTLGPVKNTGGVPTRSILNADGSKAGTITKGSAVVTFNARTIDALPNGTHKLDVTFRDFREAEGHSKANADNTLKSEIRIQRSDDDVAYEGGDPGTGSGSKTGDPMNLALWIIFGAVALAALALVTWRRRPQGGGKRYMAKGK